MPLPELAQQRPALRQLLKAVLGALIGVQSEQQRQLDFQSSSPIPYLVIGILVTLLFVLALWLTVRWVLS